MPLDSKALHDPGKAHFLCPAFVSFHLTWNFLLATLLPTILILPLLLFLLSRKTR